MNKLVTYSFNRTPYSKANEYMITTHDSTDKSYNSEPKDPGTKEFSLYDSICTRFRYMKTNNLCC